MKFTAIIPLTLAASVIAEPTRVFQSREPSLVERDVATITQVLAGINQKVGALDTSVKAFSGNIGTIQSDSAAVLSAIQAGTTSVKATSDITVTDALTVQSSVQTLTTTVKGVVSDLQSKKAALVAAGQGGVVLSTLQQQKAASAALAEAISSKVPEALQSLATTLSAGITDSLQEGIDSFQGTGSSSSAPASAPAPSASASSSSVAVAGSSSSSANHASMSGMAGMEPTSTAPITTGKPSNTTGAEQFTGAASANKISGAVGALAAVAAVLAM